MINHFIDMHGIDFTVKREDTPDQIVRGLPNHETATRKAYIGFLPSDDILSGDVLINPAGEIFHVTETSTNYFRGKPNELAAYYLTDREFHQPQRTDSIVYNIGTAYGSIIGNQENATLNCDLSINDIRKTISETNSPDKEELEKNCVSFRNDD